MMMTPLGGDKQSGFQYQSCMGTDAQGCVTYFRKSSDLYKRAALDFILWVFKNPYGVVALPLGSSAKSFVGALKDVKAHWSDFCFENQGLPGIFPDTSHLRFVQLCEYGDLSESRQNLLLQRSIFDWYVPELGLDPNNILIIDEAMTSAGQSTQACAIFEKKLFEWGGIGFICDVLDNAGSIALIMPGEVYGVKRVRLNYEHAALLAPLYGGISFSRGAHAVSVGLSNLLTCKDAQCVLIAQGAGLKAHISAIIGVDQAFSGVLPSIMHNVKGARIYATMSAQPSRLFDAQIIRIAERFKDIPVGKTIFHTAPHHDDIMLAYHPHVVNLLPHNTNIFAYLTSGSNAVTDEFIGQVFKKVALQDLITHGSNLACYEGILESFSSAYNRGDASSVELYGNFIVINCLMRGFGFSSWRELWASKEVLGKDPEAIRRAKALIRESEVDRMWSIHGVPRDKVVHMRSPFYKTKSNPSFKDDVMPLVEQLLLYKPDVVTVAFDPAGSGPDTHFLVLGIVVRSLEYLHATTGYSPQVWGYRNVWFRFDLEEANYIVPVTDKQQKSMDDIFKLCFSSQRDAEFPSPFHDGAFSELSCIIQRDQLRLAQGLLADQAIFFQPHWSGLIFLKSMEISEFLAEWAHLTDNF